MSLPSQVVFSLQGVDFCWCNRSEPRPIAALWLPQSIEPPSSVSQKIADSCEQLAGGCLWSETNEGNFWHPEARFLAKWTTSDDSEPGRPRPKSLYLPCQLDLGPRAGYPWWDWLCGSLEPKTAPTWLITPPNWLKTDHPGGLIAIG